MNLNKLFINSFKLFFCLSFILSTQKAFAIRSVGNGGGEAEMQLEFFNSNFLTWLSFCQNHLDTCFANKDNSAKTVNIEIKKSLKTEIDNHIIELNKKNGSYVLSFNDQETKCNDLGVSIYSAELYLNANQARSDSELWAIFLKHISYCHHINTGAVDSKGQMDNSEKQGQAADSIIQIHMDSENLANQKFNVLPNFQLFPESLLESEGIYTGKISEIGFFKTDSQDIIFSHGNEVHLNLLKILKAKHYTIMSVQSKFIQVKTDKGNCYNLYFKNKNGQFQIFAKFVND